MATATRTVTIRNITAMAGKLSSDELVELERQLRLFLLTMEAEKLGKSVKKNTLTMKEVVEEVKKARLEKSSKKERILANLTKGMQQALDMAKKPHKTYTAEELIDSIFDD